MTRDGGLTMAALAIATAQSALARKDIGAAQRAEDTASALLADLRALDRTRDDDSPDEPSREYDSLADAIDGTPDASGIDDERWPSRY